MRVFIVIAVLLFSAHSQAKSSGGPNDSTFFFNFNIGANGFSKNASFENEFGINISERTFGAGPFVGAGFEYRMKNHFGIHIDASTNFASRNKKLFMPALEAYYSDFDVSYQLNQVRNSPFIIGGLYTNVKIGLSYLFRVKGVGMFPRLVLGYQSSVEHNYRYTLRAPNTNYFTNYNVTNNQQWNTYFGASYTVLFSEYDLAGIVAEVGYSEMKNNYTITQSGYNQPITYKDVSTASGKVYWKLSLLLRMDFALMK
jgi:hypothetical protein